MNNKLSDALKNALAGKYVISFKTIASEAIKKVKGLKKAFWGGILVLFVIIIAIQLLEQVSLFLVKFYHFDKAIIVIQLLSEFLLEMTNTVLGVSLIFMALTHIRGEVVYGRLVFACRNKLKPLLIASLLLFILKLPLVLFNLGLFLSKPKHFSLIYLSFLLVSGLIYLYVNLCFWMAMVLIMEKNLPLKDSLMLGFRAVSRQAFKNFFLILFFSIFNIIFGMLTLGIWLIWGFPAGFNLAAIQYRQIFGLTNTEKLLNTNKP